MNISKFEIITEKKKWDKVLSLVKLYDCYHTYDYHQLAKNEDETPILIKYEKGDCIISLPFLLRRIFDTEYYDLTSVYGYSGPVFINVNKTELVNEFKLLLDEYFYKEKIISVFTRLNPFISNQDHIIKGVGKTIKLSKIVNIDLTKSIEDQKTSFSKTTKRYINKTRKLCDIRIGNSAKEIETFIDLYYENMNRVNAKQSYYFDRKYFDSFINSKDFETNILFATLKETNTIISAAMMIKTNGIIQYHISGTRDEYLNLTPIRILIDEMRILGTKQNFTYFNLGGGLGSSEDSLFNFKSSFSKDFMDFKVWKYIVNQNVYNQLVSKYSNLAGNQNFFPLYRN